MESPESSVIFIREWEGQMSSSGCCGRLEGDFLRTGDREPVFAERRAAMDAMGPLYRALRERFGPDLRLEVIDPRSFVTLVVVLVRDFWAHRVGIREALRTITRLPVQGLVVNGRLVARGSWPDPGDVIDLLDPRSAELAERSPR